jgi:hypothetical protein
MTYDEINEQIPEIIDLPRSLLQHSEHSPYGCLCPACWLNYTQHFNQFIKDNADVSKA